MSAGFKDLREPGSARTLLEHLAAQSIAHEPFETYSNGVRHVKIPDPDGNAIAFAELPDAATA